MKKMEDKKIIVLSCLAVFFCVMLLSVGTGALSQMVADGADRGLSFVTECGDGSPVVSYITEEYGAAEPSCVPAGPEAGR